MSRETYETYSAEPEKIDLIAFLAEYFQAFRKFFLGVLILVIPHGRRLLSDGKAAVSAHV